MIHQVLPVIVDELNVYLKNKFHQVEDKAVLSNLIDQDGTLAVEGYNKIIASLVSIDRDTTTKNVKSNNYTSNGIVELPSPVNINLTILFSALFTKNLYAESLKYISGVIYFFQSKSVFNQQNTPKLSSGIDRIYFDMLTIPMQEQMNIFSMLGAKYMPSVVYRMRMLTFVSENISKGISGIGNTDIRIK